MSRVVAAVAAFLAGAGIGAGAVIVLGGEPVTLAPAVEIAYACGFDQVEPRFTSDATLTNVGTIDAVVEVTSTWLLPGGDTITDTKRVEVEAGARGLVTFTVPATGEQIERHRQLDPTSETCRVELAAVEKRDAS